MSGRLTPASGGGGAVDSVNTQTGAVVLDADDINDSVTTNKFAIAAELTKLAGIEAGAEVNDVASVNAQTGVVVLDIPDLNSVEVGRYYTMEATARVSSTRNANILYAMPLHVDPDGMNVDRIGSYVGTTVGALGRLGLYSSLANSSGPNALIDDCGTVDMSTGGFKEIAINEFISDPTNIVWLAMVLNATTSVPIGATSGSLIPRQPAGINTSVSSLPGFMGVEAGFAFGALPVTFPSFTHSSLLPLIVVRAA